MKFRYLYLQEVTALGEVGSVGAFLFRHELQQSLVPNILENGQIIVTQGYLGLEGLELQHHAHFFQHNSASHQI